MKHYVGLDVSIKQTGICIVDEAGKIMREAKVATELAAIVAVLNAAGVECARVGLEAGPTSQWLVSGLLEAGLPVVCVETRHMKAVLKAQQVNKSDRNDARGIAQMMRVGLYKPVHVKTLASQEERMLLTSRKLLRDKLQDMENELRGTLRNFGLRVGVVSSGHFEARVRELVAGHPPLGAIVAPLLAVRRVLREQFARLHKMVLERVRRNRLCRRLMTVPGVGGRGADLSGDGRSAAAFCPLQGGRGAFRLGTAPFSVRRDGLRREDFEMRGRHDADGSL
jgi:transposase